MSLLANMAINVVNIILHFFSLLLLVRSVSYTHLTLPTTD